VCERRTAAERGRTVYATMKERVIARESETEIAREREKERKKQMGEILIFLHSPSCLSLSLSHTHTHSRWGRMEERKSKRLGRME